MLRLGYEPSLEVLYRYDHKSSPANAGCRDTLAIPVIGQMPLRLPRHIIGPRLVPVTGMRALSVAGLLSGLRGSWIKDRAHRSLKVRSLAGGARGGRLRPGVAIVPRSLPSRDLMPEPGQRLRPRRAGCEAYCLPSVLWLTLPSTGLAMLAPWPRSRMG